MRIATFQARANIAFIKYWGVRDSFLNLPYTNSISMTLSDAHSTTTVAWLDHSQHMEDEILLNGKDVTGGVRFRTVEHLDRLREFLDHAQAAKVVSVNNFPSNAGIASSASGFCALTLAGAAAWEQSAEHLELGALASLARRASGSACRSFYGGFVEWQGGTKDKSSFPLQLHPPQHWALSDVVAVLNSADKKVSSQQGHELAASSFLLQDRVEFVRFALPLVREAVRSRNLKILGPILEKDALFMHAVMLTSQPSLLYLNDAAISLMQLVQTWRSEEGLQVYFTIDAGPNLHLICQSENEGLVAKRLEKMDSVSQVIVNRPGSGPSQMAEHLF